MIVLTHHLIPQSPVTKRMMKRRSLDSNALQGSCEGCWGLLGRWWGVLGSAGECLGVLGSAGEWLGSGWGVVRGGELFSRAGEG